jgi:hypothetical protein
MTQKPPRTGRFCPARDRWTRRTIAAVGAMAVGSLIARRAARSAGQAASATADAEASGPTERATPMGQAVAQTMAVRLRRTGIAAAGRLGAAGRAAWRELQHPDHGTSTGPDPATPSASSPEDAETEGKTGAEHAPAIADQTKTP